MIADLHCDLLLYLQGSLERTPFDALSRCSIPQMRAGGVKIQVLPIFTETEESSASKGEKQNGIFHSLYHQYPSDYVHFTRPEVLKEHSSAIAILRSVENASAFCNESESLENGLQRLSRMQNEGPIVYISLTWNTENRFGGGISTEKGLKDDGKSLLHFLHKRRVAVDLSHASDYLAYDILDHIDKHKLDIPIIASHSNCRAINNTPRNLPNGLITEIIKRNGIIGLNFIKYFLGFSSHLFLAKHLEHILLLKGEDNVCFGADFFFEEDIPIASRRPSPDYFFDEFSNSSTYKNALEIFRKNSSASPQLLDKIAFQTAASFLMQRILLS